MWPTRPHCDKDVRNYPDSYVHMANMGPTWVLSAPYVPHVGPMNLESGYVYFWSEFECAWPVNKVGCVVAHSPVFCVIQFFHPPHTPCSSSCLWKVRLTPLGGLTRNNSKWQLALVFYKGRAYEWQCKAGQHVQDVVHVGLSQGDGLRPCVWPQDPWQPQKLQLCCGCALDCEGTVCSAQCHTSMHYKLRAVIMPSVSSLIARHVGFMTICGANSVDKVGIMTLKTKSCFDTNFCTTGDAVRDKKVGIVINIGFQYGCSTAPTKVKRELFLSHLQGSFVYAPSQWQTTLHRRLSLAWRVHKMMYACVHSSWDALCTDCQREEGDSRIISAVTLQIWNLHWVSFKLVVFNQTSQ